VKKTVVVLAIAILLISSFPTIVFAAPPDNPASVSDLSSSQQILVKFRPGTGLPEAAQIHRQLGGQVKGTIAGIGVQVVTVPKGQAKEKAKAYSARYGVAYAEADYMAEALAEPDDSYFTAQWNMQKVGAPGAWDVTTGSPNVTIAILDTGVDLDHPDLAGKIVDNRNFTTSNTTDDIYGHGTHVAGIAAAITNNGLGVAGLGYASSIMNIKVLGDDGMGYWSWIAQGIIWAADNDAQIINLSLGGSDGSSTLEDAINYAWSKGVVVVAAAGNNGNTVPVYPAYYANCIAVAATDASDARPLWSNYGDWVDVAAPGYRILSTSKNDNYVYMSGTSMATPHVAGLAALLFTTVSDTNGNGKLNDEVRSWMEASCDDVCVSGIGHGRVNAVRAVGSVPVLPGKISGQVTNAGDGLPVVGATVTDGTRTVLTDSAGQYTISDVPPGTYQVVASKNGYESSALPVTVLAGTTTVASFTLNEVIVPGSISGAVVSAKDGSPLIGATVTDGTRTTTTDATGKYTITNVPAGTYQVTASNSGYYSSSSTVTVVSVGNAIANFSLSQIPGSITGSVTDAKDGSPIVGAMVADGARTATTDASGKYTIVNVPPGTYQVTVSKSGYYSSSLTATVVSGTITVANFSLSQIPGNITGSVTNAKDGSAIVGAVVTDGTRTATTDASGKYTIVDVPPGTYQVTVSKSGYYSSSLTATVVSGTITVANFPLSQIPGSITGSVTNAKDGSPIVGAAVTDGTRTATTNASGKYTIADVPSGTYQVVASKVGYQSLTTSVAVVSGATSVKDFSLNQDPPVANAMWVDSIQFTKNGNNLVIEVKVVTASGVLPRAKVVLSLKCSNGRIWRLSGTTGTTGVVRFWVSRAPVGSYLSTVTSLTRSGFTWDRNRGITSASYALSLYLSQSKWGIGRGTVSQNLWHL
jgi:thermitase